MLQKELEEIDTIDQKMEAAQSALSAVQIEFQELRESYSTTFPILALPQYSPGISARADDEGVSRITGRWTEDILENIDDTEESILDEDVKVWDLNDVGELAYQQMGIDAQGPLGQAVRAYIADEESDAGLLQMARSAAIHGVKPGSQATTSSSLPFRGTFSRVEGAGTAFKLRKTVLLCRLPANSVGRPVLAESWSA